MRNAPEHMSADQARKILILSSLAIIGAQLVFLVIAPSFGYPLENSQNIALLQISLPVFMGYLGAATHFIFMVPPPKVQVNKPFLGVLVTGPLVVYTVATIAAFFAFGYSNRPGAPMHGMSVEMLTSEMTTILSLLSVTTSVLVSFLFAADRNRNNISKK